jgi:hypothetical protein
VQTTSHRSEYNRSPKHQRREEQITFDATSEEWQAGTIAGH